MVPLVPIFDSRRYHQLNVALNMLEQLLSFDPMQRINVDEALAHEYLAAYHDSEDVVLQS